MQDHNVEILYQTIGRSIVKRRKTLKWTQAKLAKLVGITRTSVVNIEKGRQRLPLHVLYTMALRMDIDPFELLPSIDHIVNGELDDQYRPDIRAFLDKT